MVSTVNPTGDNNQNHPTTERDGSDSGYMAVTAHFKSRRDIETRVDDGYTTSATNTADENNNTVSDTEDL